jgi:choline dehydrogenase-like flavoprotein
MVAAMFEQEGLLPPPAHGFTLSACVVKPQSRGQVAVVSPDPTTKPFILHNYFAEPEDMRSAVAGLRAGLEIARTAPLAQYAQIAAQRPASDSDADLEAHIRHTRRRSTTRRARAGWASTTSRWSTRAARARRGGPAGGRRVDLPVGPARQHQRADHRGGGAGL